MNDYIKTVLRNARNETLETLRMNRAALAMYVTNIEQLQKAIAESLVDVAALDALLEGATS